MKKSIKFLAVISAFVLLVSSLFVISVSAADVAYSASNVSGKKGETVTVSVKISTDKKIWGANVMLGYNPSELQYVSSSEGDAFSNGSIFNNGSSVNFSGTFAKTKGTIYTVKFKILKDSGTSTLKLTSTENIDYNGKSYTCSATNGVVTILDSSALSGDVNNDGKVSSLDARHVLQHVAGLRTFNSTQLKLADVNKDDKINSLDARWILQIAAGIRK